MKPETENKRPTNNRLRYLIVALIVALAGVALAWAMYRPSSPPPLPVVRLNIVTWPGYGPIYLAQEKGFFREEGIEVDCQIQENTQARNAALVSGQVDLIGNTLESVVLANAEGLPMQVIGVTDISNGGDGIVAKPEIQSIQDLKGKRVAFPEGQPSHLLLLYHLDKAGLSPDDIKPIYTEDGGKAGEIFAAGQADAAVTWEPWLSRVVEAKKGHVLVDSKGVKDILISIFAANRNNVGKNSDKLQRFLRGWYRGLDYAQAHMDEATPIMARGFQLPSQEFADIMGGLRFMPKGEVKQLLGADGSAGAFEQIVRYEESLWRKASVSKQAVPPADTYTAEIIKGVN